MKTRFSNSQIYGFFGLFLVNCIWTWYALMFGRMILRNELTFEFLKEMMPYFGIFVGIPLSISFLISYRMYTHKILSRFNYFLILWAGFFISFMFVITKFVFNSD